MVITNVPPEYFKSFRNDRQIEEEKMMLGINT